MKQLLLAITAIGMAAICQSQTLPQSISNPRIYGLALNGKAKEILAVLDTMKLKSKNDSLFKDIFRDRFTKKEDTTSTLKGPYGSLNKIYSLYKSYWKEALTGKNRTKKFEKRLARFLRIENEQLKFSTKPIRRAELDSSLKLYISKLGFNTTGFGKVGSYVDLLVWQTQKDTTYHVKLPEDSVNVQVCMMSSFASLGWEEYVTLGRHYPGGWATHEKLFCVEEAYDQQSENFKVSYLAHEGQHFSDYKHHPALTSAQLEYRAKLTELCYANTTLQKTVSFFLRNADASSSNPHPWANYNVMSNLSKIIFEKELEKDAEAWKSIPNSRINQAAKQLLIQHTSTL